MPLPSSGVIKFSDIRTELGVPNQTPFKLGEAERGTYTNINYNSTLTNTNPARVSKWYNYTQSPPLVGYGEGIYYALKG